MECFLTRGPEGHLCLSDSEDYSSSNDAASLLTLPSRKGKAVFETNKHKRLHRHRHGKRPTGFTAVARLSHPDTLPRRASPERHLTCVAPCQSLGELDVDGFFRVHNRRCGWTLTSLSHQGLCRQGWRGYALTAFGRATSTRHATFRLGAAAAEERGIVLHRAPSPLALPRGVGG
jgi:hypothetical protein